MRSFVWTLLCLSAATPALAASAPGAFDTTAAPSIRSYLQIRTPGPPVLLPDGSLLLRDWPDGVYQLYRVVPARDAAGHRSYRPGDASFTRLTSFPDGLSRFSVSPDGRHVVLMHARGGDENTQLTLMDVEQPDDRRAVLSNPNVQASVHVWLRDGSGFLYSANADSPTDFHLYRYDLASGGTTRVLAQEGDWQVRDVTADGARALVQRNVSASDVRPYELDLATGTLRDLGIVPAQGTAACEVIGYLPDERSALLVSDARGGLKRLYVRALATGAVREPVPAIGRHELVGARLDDSRELLAVLTDEDGYRIPHVYTLPEFRPLSLPLLERGVASVASFRGRALVWTHSNARTPGTAFATRFAAGVGGQRPEHVQLTWTDDQGVDLGRAPLPRLVRYRAFDGRSIPAFLYLPRGHRPGTPVPFLVVYHGGPEGQNQPGFNATLQYFVARGYGLLLPNVRGSIGYGRAYEMLDNYTRRWDSVRDGVDAAEWLVRAGYARPGAIATYGGSYGGFMSVACVVEDQDRVDRGRRKTRLFGACVDVVGIVNLRTFLEKTSGYRRKLREVEYGPLADTTFLASVSSIHRADKIQVPVFIAHGFNDPRVPVEEAMQLATALKQRGRSPRLFIAPDEGHGFAKLDNRIYFYERVAAFLDATIGGSGAANGPRAVAVDSP